MADEFKGISNETLRNIELLKSSMRDIASSTSKANKSLQNQSLLVADYASNFSKINQSASKFAELQDKATKSANATAEAYKEQQKQLSVVRSLNAQIDNLYDQILTATESQSKILKRQVENLSAARDNAQELAREYRTLVDDSSKLDKSTMWFSALSKVTGDIPGLRKISGPFEEAAKASRETALNNAKIKSTNESIASLGSEALRTGKGLTAEKLKELGLTEIVGNKTGAAAKNALKQYQEQNKVQSVGIAGLQSGFKALGPIMSSALGPLAIITTIVSAVKALIDMMFEADEQVTNIAKSLNVSKDAAVGVRDRFFDISKRAEYLSIVQKGNLINQKDLVETQLQLNQALGIAVDLSQTQNEEFAVQLTNARKFLKLSEEETKGLVGLYSTTGKSIDEIKNSILGTTRLRKIESGIMLDERKILKDVLTTSNAIKLSVKGGVEGLTKAAIEAAKLGSDLKSVENISKGLLNFEESISSELEAELLIGRDLNLETARRAALNGDLETVAKEINRQIGSSADFSRMNVIQQEALAKAMGTSREELADMLVQQESLNKLKSNFNALGKETIENLKKSGKIDEATYNNLISGKAASTDYYNALKQAGMAQEEIVKILGNEAASSLESQSAQEKFNDALERAKEIFSSFVDGGYLDSLADTLVDIIKWLQGYTEGEEQAVATARELKQQGNLSEEEQKRVDALQKTATQETEFFGFAWDAIKYPFQNAMGQVPDLITDWIKDTAAEDAQAELKKIKSEKINPEDTKIPAKDFIIKTLEEDTVVAAGGTNLGRTDEMVTLLKDLIQATKTGKDLYIDSSKVTGALQLTNYKSNYGKR